MQLYKYLKPSRIDVIENLQIRFSRPNDFNDPFESLPSLGGLKELAGDEKFYNENLKERFDVRLKESLIKHLPENVKVPDEFKDSYTKMTLGEAALKICGINNILKTVISEYSDKVEDQIATIINRDFNNRFGILCLSEKHDNLIMWSHYSQNHEGFVIGFDSKSPFFDQRKSKTDLFRNLTKVEYLNERPELILYNIKKPSQEFGEYVLKYALLTKSKHWAEEQEWRMVMDLKDADTIQDLDNGKIFLFRYPSTMITSIYLGVKIKDKIKDNIIHITEDLKINVPIYQAYRDSKKYAINFKQIEK